MKWDSETDAILDDDYEGNVQDAKLLKGNEQKIY